jgi:hypothetical protein
MRSKLLALSVLLAGHSLPAQGVDALQAQIDRASLAIAPKVTAWRHDIHGRQSSSRITCARSVSKCRLVSAVTA